MAVLAWCHQTTLCGMFRVELVSWSFHCLAGSGAGGFGGGGGGYGAAAGGGYGAQQAYAQPAYGGFGQQVCVSTASLCSWLEVVNASVQDHRISCGPKQAELTSE